MLSVSPTIIIVSKDNIKKIKKNYTKNTFINIIIALLKWVYFKLYKTLALWNLLKDKNL